MFYDVVDTLCTTRIPGEAALLTKLVEVVNAPGEHLVDVGLMPGVPHQDIARRFEDAMECNRQFDDTKIRAQMTAGGRHLLYEEGADLPGQHRKLLDRQGTNIMGIADPTQQTHFRILRVNGSLGPFAG